MLIESMRAEDIPEVSDLLKACFRWLAEREHFTAAQTAFLVDERSSVETVRQESRIRPHLVAREEGAILGVVAVKDNEIARLYVHPRYHRRGVGKALFDAGINLICAAGHREATVAALVDSSAAFYRSMGMTETGRQVYEPDIFLGREVILLAKPVT
ncbi:MAG TPA: GNAT family N-acetyltransferase [Phycisphaerae bacterium]|nr:GNAT family N-acetyltransferase [Phycisphaerae bacterium]HRY69618.1 GNAT family N-acetyltransferase [Phycisphaerae bacterium]HSA27267.1 GNAT family N-acetyltransferase [Phycisphaerae bacterium]